MVHAYELFIGRTLYPADPARLFILWIADIIVQERVIINESAKQNVPRYAEGKYLDSLAEIFKDMHRLAPVAAKTIFRFYLSMPVGEQCLIPAGTRVTVDGDITFKTIQHLYIDIGHLYGDVSAECMTVGTVGNGFVQGQITQLIDVYPYFEKVENITKSEGGSEQEDDHAFYNRMRESTESYSTAGSAGAYIYHTKMVSPQIVDVTAHSTDRGIVDIRVLLENGEIPSKELLGQIEIHLSSNKIRPLTDVVKVLAPNIYQFDIKTTYFLPTNGSSSNEVLEIAIVNAIGEYEKWQTQKMGRDINPSYLITKMMQAGAKRVEVESPMYTLIDENTVAQHRAIEIVNGGCESE